MIERPILFSGPMVRAIAAGAKTRTRRVIPYFDGSTYARDPARVTEWKQHRPEIDRTRKWWAYAGGASSFPLHGITCRYGAPGDRLWVRETFGIAYKLGRFWTALPPSDPKTADAIRGFVYRADISVPENAAVRWVPSIHMPRRASRFELEVAHVWVERLQEIDEAEARAEGVDGVIVGDRVYYKDYLVKTPGETSFWLTSARESFRTLWESLNRGRGFGWDLNPWVFVVAFSRVPFRTVASAGAAVG